MKLNPNAKIYLKGILKDDRIMHNMAPITYPTNE